MSAERQFIGRRVWIGAAALASIGASRVAVAQNVGEKVDQRDDGSAPRIREGRTIGPIDGEIIPLATRWTFRSNAAGEEQATALVCLENLMLQRIVDSIAKDPTDRFWQITAVVTEFSGVNFLLIATAVRAAGTKSE